MADYVFRIIEETSGEIEKNYNHRPKLYLTEGAAKREATRLNNVEAMRRERYNVQRNWHYVAQRGEVVWSDLNA